MEKVDDLHLRLKTWEKGAWSDMKKPEKWFQFLGAGQKLVYILLSLMPLQYQRENLEAMLSRFLEDLLDTRYLNIVKPSQPVR